MGSEWEGGKGDRSRVENRKQFWDNYDRIFRSSPKQTDLFDENIEHPLAIGETAEQRTLENLQHDWQMMYEHILSTNNHDVLSKLRNK